MDFFDLTHGFAIDDMHAEPQVEGGQFVYDVRTQDEVEEAERVGEYVEKSHDLHEPDRLGVAKLPQRGLGLLDLGNRPHSVTAARGGVRFSIIFQVDRTLLLNLILTTGFTPPICSVHTTSLPYPTLPYPTLPYPTLPYPALPCPTPGTPSPNTAHAT